MSFLKVNPDNAGGFSPIKPGKYEVVISEVKKDKAKSSGAEMLKLTLTIRSNVDQEFKKRKVFDNLVVSENAMFRFDQVAVACGYGKDHDFATIDEFAKAIRGQVVAVTIKNETYDGKIQDRVAQYHVSEYPVQRDEEEAGEEYDGGIEVSEDDLPF